MTSSGANKKIKEIRDKVMWLDTLSERVILEELSKEWTFDQRCAGEGGVSHIRGK